MIRPPPRSALVPVTTLFRSGTDVDTSETWVYDDNGNVTEYTDPNGTVITQTYDAMGRVLTKDVVAADLPTSETSVSHHDGNVTPYTDPNATVTTQTYDALRR